MVPGTAVVRIGGVAALSTAEITAASRANQAFAQRHVIITGAAVEVAPPPLQLL